MSVTRLASRASPGALFRQLVAEARPARSAPSNPLPIIGTPNAYTALLAQHCGARAIYLSGSSVSTVSHGLPDLGFINACDVAEDTRRITAACALPLLVDVDTGLSSGVLGIRRTIQMVEAAGACGVHVEDQRVEVKRCGHRAGKAVVSVEEMCERIHAAVSARSDPHFVVMARTDALAVDPSIPSLLARLTAPVLANITEFGMSPLWTQAQLGSVHVSMALYPVSAQRAMAKAAMTVMSSVINEGSVQRVLPDMQTRSELYEILNYSAYEQQQGDHEVT
jgi:methylisocitrate lyase